MNAGVDVSLTVVFSGYMPRSGIVGSYGNSVFTSVMNLCAVLHSGSTHLQNISF